MDAWEIPIADFLAERTCCTVIEVASQAIILDASRLTVTEQRRITAILQRLGWVQQRNTKRRWWEPGAP